MGKRYGTAVVGLLVAMSIVGSSPAAASTEFGSNCVGDNAAENFTLFQLQSAPGSALPVTAPTAGVITQWKVQVISFPGAIPHVLKVLRPTGGQLTVIAQSSSGVVVSGLNTFATRIPVQVGDRVGIYANSEIGTLYCKTSNASDLLGAFAGDAPVGSTQTPLIEPGAQVPVSAVIEPDADGDGFGDETQDKCPQNAAFQAPCPVANLSASSIVKKGFAKVLVTSDVQVPVKATGTVKLGKGRSAKLRGGTQTVVPGTLAKFTLLFPAALKSKLEQLSRKQSLLLKLTVAATNPVGPPTVRTLKVKLRGQAKP